MDSLELLTFRMKESTPTLLLGAGFSVGAINAQNKPLFIGKQLANYLHDYFYIKRAPSKYTRKELDEINAAKDNLREICTFIASEGRRADRDLLIQEVYSGSIPSNKQVLHKLTAYNWQSIFTLNVDDLVENIYRIQDQSLNVWNKSSYGKRKDFKAPTLIKLHGCINDINSGLIFDDDEYRSFTASQDCLLKEFAHEFISNDVILLGTEFQEEDLQIAIKIYEQSGYDGSGNQYFIISPGINSLKMRNILGNLSNFHWIKMTAEDFLTHISEKITTPIGAHKLLKEKGVIFINYIFMLIM